MHRNGQTGIRQLPPRCEIMMPDKRQWSRCWQRERKLMNSHEKDRFYLQFWFAKIDRNYGSVSTYAICVYDCVVFQRQVQLESLHIYLWVFWPRDDGWCLHRWPILWSCGLSAGLKNKITFNGHSLPSRINCSCTEHGVQQTNSMRGVMYKQIYIFIIKSLVNIFLNRVIHGDQSGFKHICLSIRHFQINGSYHFQGFSNYRAGEGGWIKSNPHNNNNNNKELAAWRPLHELNLT